jgi:hypothetical protein
MKIINGLIAVQGFASKTTFDECVNSAAYDEGYEAMMMGWEEYCAPVTRTWLEAAFDLVAACWTAFVCGAYGHDYETADIYLWPHDGYERIECTRCGLSHDCWH